MKVKWSGLGVVDASGRLGGDVAARNRNGPYMRTKGQATNPNTIYQQAWRTRLTTFTQMWATLSPDQITAWNRATYQIPRSRFLASLAPCRGQLAFIRLNAYADFVGASLILNPPTPVPIPAVEPSNYYVREGGTRWVFDSDGSSVGSPVFIWATPALPPGRRFIKNALRLVTWRTLLAANPQDFTLEADARFPAPVLDQYVALVIQRFDPTTMSIGAPLLTTAFVQV